MGVSLYCRCVSPRPLKGGFSNLVCVVSSSLRPLTACPYAVMPTPTVLRAGQKQKQAPLTATPSRSSALCAGSSQV